MQSLLHKCLFAVAYQHKLSLGGIYHATWFFFNPSHCAARAYCIMLMVQITMLFAECYLELFMLQALRSILEDPHAYHLGIHGRHTYVQRMTSCMAKPLPRNFTTTSMKTTITLGGTKGLGSKYAMKVNYAFIVNAPTKPHGIRVPSCMVFRFILYGGL